MEYKNIHIEKEGAVAVITIDRPKALNSLNFHTLKELQCAFYKLASEKSIGTVILTGSGEKAFVAGADISYMQSLSANEAAEFGRLGHSVMEAVENARQPVIAAVNGFALGGGCEIALACDIRVAAENAKFGLPEVGLGVIPGFGGTQRLPRLVGKGMACELIYTGGMIDAREALRIGLVNKVVPQDGLMEVCRDTAMKITTKSPLAVSLCKETVNNGMQMDLARACQYERAQFSRCFASSDQTEGMAAFLEKRKAEFTGS